MKKTVYTDAEREAYVPAPCPRCGKSDRVTVDWLPDGKGNWVHGLMDCPCQGEALQSEENLFGATPPASPEA